MIALLQVLIALCAALVAAGILALVQLGLLVYHGILGTGASLTEGETPESTARGNGPRLPSVTEDRTATEAQVHSGSVVAVSPEVRRASATVQLGWDHTTQRPTMTVHPESIEAPREA